MSQRDLFVVVADLDAENVMKTLLAKRQEALAICLDFNPTVDLLRYSGRDPGCYKNAADLMRTPLATHRHGLLCFDRHGLGGDAKTRLQIESELEARLYACGWQAGTVAVIVLDPELEAWVWANSTRVADVLGWKDDRTGLRPFLEGQNLWLSDALKPADPKEAMKRALREKGRPWSAPLYAELAETVGVGKCQDAAFIRLCQALTRWFPRPPASMHRGTP